MLILQENYTLRGNMVPIGINSLPLIDTSQTLDFVPQPTEKSEGAECTEQKVSHCLDALNMGVLELGVSGETKIQTIAHLPQTMLPQQGINREQIKLLLSRLSSLAKGRFLSEESKVYARKCAKAFARQLFESNPSKVCQGLLQRQFSPSLHIELVRVIAKSHSMINIKWVTANIASLGIEDEKERIALAKMAAQSFLPTNGSVTLMERMKLTKKYAIHDESAIVDILKIMIKSNVGYIRYLGRLSGVGQKSLTELIKYSLHCSAYSIFAVPKKLITDQHCMADIFLTCVKEATFPAQIFSWIEFPPELQTLKKGFQLIMGPEMDFLERKSTPYEIPVQDVIVILESFFQENFPHLSLSSIIEIIENKALTQHEVKILLSTLAWTVELMSKKLTFEQTHWVIQQNLLKYVLAYRDPTMRYQLSETIVQVASSLECRNHYEELNHESVKHTLLANLFLGQMKKQGVNIRESVQNLENQRHFREANNKKLLIEALMSIRDSKQLSASDKSNLLSHIFKHSAESASNLYRTLAVLSMGQDAFLKESTLTSISEAARLAERHMVGVFFNNEVKLENMDKYEELFSRNSSAFFIYAAKLHALPEGVSYKNPLIQCLKVYLQSVLEGEFEKIRYEKLNNLHLQTVFPEDAQNLFESWKKGDVRPLEEMLPSMHTKHFPGVQLDFEEFMRDHLANIRDTPCINYVDDFLNATSKEERSLINTKLGFAIKQQKEKTSSQMDPILLTHLLFAHCLIDFARQKISFSEQFFQDAKELRKFEMDYRRKTNEIKKKMDKICEMGRLICLNSEFLAHIEGLDAQIPKVIEVNSYKNWTIADTDNPQDLFLCGTEIIGSCQNVNNHIELNKCLPAYLIDGKNRMLVIKDDRGKIRMRAIWRILWDATKTKQVLFKEKIYPEGGQRVLIEALNQFAILRAQVLNLRLLTKLSNQSDSKYNARISSLGGPVPFEYVDAIKSVINEGVFEIEDAAILYTP